MLVQGLLQGLVTSITSGKQMSLLAVPFPFTIALLLVSMTECPWGQREEHSQKPGDWCGLKILLFMKQAKRPICKYSLMSLCLRCYLGEQSSNFFVVLSLQIQLLGIPTR